MNESPISDEQKMGAVARCLREIYKAVADLERLFPGRHFTPDGHMVGSIGEAWASWMYGIKLLPSSSETHDAVAPNGVLIQVKATQGDRVALSSEPEHLIVLRILRDGTASEIYNGPGRTAWSAVGKLQKNGQRSISVARLRELMKSLGSSDRIAQLRSL